MNRFFVLLGVAAATGGAIYAMPDRYEQTMREAAARMKRLSDDERRRARELANRPFKGALPGCARSNCSWAGAPDRGEVGALTARFKDCGYDGRHSGIDYEFANGRQASVICAADASLTPSGGSDVNRFEMLLEDNSGPYYFTGSAALTRALLEVGSTNKSEGPYR